MISSGDAQNAYENLIKAGTPEFLAKLMSKAPYLALNFKVWLFALFCLVCVGFVDWKYPHLFPKKFRRVRLSDTQKKELPVILENVSEILSDWRKCPNLSEKNDLSCGMLGKISTLRTKASSLPSGNLSFAILDYCKYSGRVWTRGKNDMRDLRKMEMLGHKIAKLVTRYTD